MKKYITNKKVTTLSQSKGFTLIELLVVIGILAVLLSIVLIAINPARQFAQANDTQRKSNVTAILNAIGAYAADNHGALPAGMTAPLAVAEISKAGVDICASIMPTYISALPQDPNSNNGAQITDCTAYDTGYKVAVDANKRVTISATPDTAGTGLPITITR
jgi:prepilin-type N-terminal cleavage/methylation domain-containing protein